MALQPQPPKRCWKLPFCNRCKQHQRFLFKHGPVMILAHHNIIENPSFCWSATCHHQSASTIPAVVCSSFKERIEGSLHLQKATAMSIKLGGSETRQCIHMDISLKHRTVLSESCSTSFWICLGYICVFFFRPPGSLLGWTTASRLRVCSKDRTISCFVARGSWCWSIQQFSQFRVWGLLLHGQIPANPRHAWPRTCCCCHDETHQTVQPETRRQNCRKFPTFHGVAWNQIEMSLAKPLATLELSPVWKRIEILQSSVAAMLMERDFVAIQAAAFQPEIQDFVANMTFQKCKVLLCSLKRSGGWEAGHERAWGIAGSHYVWYCQKQSTIHGWNSGKETTIFYQTTTAFPSNKYETNIPRSAVRWHDKRHRNWRLPHFTTKWLGLPCFTRTTKHVPWPFQPARP